MPTQSLAHPKHNIRIGSWNVRTMYRTGKTAEVTREMERYNIDVLGISECRWIGHGRLKTTTGETILYSGHENENEHYGGVAMIISQKTVKSLESWNPVNDRIMTARFHSRYIKTTLIQVYAPTNDADDDTKDDFYDQLQKTVDEVPGHDMLIIMGDLNAKVGLPQEEEEEIIGMHGLKCERNDNGERFVDFCTAHRCPIMTTMFPHKDIHKYTWTSPDGKYRNQIDHFAVRAKFRKSVRNVRAYRGADAASDHNLIIMSLKLKLKRAHGKTTPRKTFETNKLKVPEIQKEFQIQLRNVFSCLAEEANPSTPETDSTEEIESCWKTIRDGYNSVAEKVLGPRTKESKPWVSANSWKKIDERRELKKKREQAKSERRKTMLANEYKEKDKEVKRSMRHDKREWMENIARDAEENAHNGNMKGVYDATRKLCNVCPKGSGAVRNKEGRILTREDEVLQRWKEHFEEILNREEPETIAEVDTETPVIDDISSDYITKEEIYQAVQYLKNGKTPGDDTITAELLKADIKTTICLLHKIFRMVWDCEWTPEDWRNGLIVKIPKKGDTTNCGNWRGITLMSIVGKVLSKIVITRIAQGVDQKLRKEQAGFRKGRNTTEQIFVLRNVIEQSIEWNSTLYSCFIDFEKAFDSVHRPTLWSIMKHYGIPTKLIEIVKAMYHQSKCAVINGATKTDWFEVRSGVKQGCSMSGFLFLLVIDWVMRKTERGAIHGIRWVLHKQIGDLDFADDIALLSSSHEHMQRKVSALSKEAKSTGLKVNTQKTKLLRINTKATSHVCLDGEEIEEVKSFEYLGAKVTNKGGADEDIRRRIGKAWAAFNKLNKIWNSGELQRKTKIKIFKSNVLAVLLYGSETWKMTRGDEKRLNTFLHKALRRILKIRWPMKVSNDEIRRRVNLVTISEMVAHRRWRWIGHVLRMENNSIPRVALTWTPDGRRKRGRPRETWRRTVEREREAMGFTSWREATTAAADRTTWRRRIHGPILHEERRE